MFGFSEICKQLGSCKHVETDLRAQDCIAQMKHLCFEQEKRPGSPLVAYSTPARKRSLSFHNDGIE